MFKTAFRFFINVVGFLTLTVILGAGLMFAGATLTQRYELGWFGLYHGKEVVEAAMPEAAVASRLSPAVPTEHRAPPAAVGVPPAITVAPETREPSVRPAPARSCPDPEIVRTDPSQLGVCVEAWDERETQARSAVRFLNGLARAYKRR